MSFDHWDLGFLRRIHESKPLLSESIRVDFDESLLEKVKGLNIYSQNGNEIVQGVFCLQSITINKRREL